MQIHTLTYSYRYQSSLCYSKIYTEYKHNNLFKITNFTFFAGALSVRNDINSNTHTHTHTHTHARTHTHKYTKKNVSQFILCRNFCAVLTENRDALGTL